MRFGSTESEATGDPPPFSAATGRPAGDSPADPPALVLPEFAAGMDDLAFLSDAARSKVVALVRSISAQFAGSAAGIRRDVSREAAGKDRERLRAIWTESLANDISARAYNEASIRISRERREVWVCRPGPGDDPTPKTYRMQDQPNCFETHMKLWEASTRGFDLSIEYLRKSLAKLDEMPPEEAPVPLPAPARMFGRPQA